MGGKSIGFAGGAAAGGAGSLSGLLNCCRSKERLAYITLLLNSPRIKLHYL